MIEYYDLLNEEEQDDMRDLIQLLLRQTFLLGSMTAGQEGWFR